MTATIKDIAKQANVSVATVSRVLNGRDGFFSKKTEKKIKKIAADLGYQKNLNATELVTKKGNTIGVIVSATKTNFANHIIEGIQAEAFKHDLSVIIVFAGENDKMLQKKALKTITERPIKGLLILGIELSEENLQILKTKDVPFLFLSTEFPKQTAPFVTTNNFQLTYKAAKFLLNKGYKKIGLAGIDVDSYMGQQRVEGYSSALKESQIHILPYWIQPGMFTYQDGIKAMKNYYRESPLEAVLSGSDYIALGIMNQARNYGLKVPQDLGVMSMDGTELTRIAQPEITSVVQSFYEMGVQGARLLQTKLSNSFYKYVDFKIVEGSSTCQLR